MPLLATRFTKGIARIGPVPLDVEANTTHTKQRTFSERRIADGSQASDHSQNEPDELVLAGVVDSISPLSAIGINSTFTGRFLQYERLADLVRSGDEIEIVCARGLFVVTARTFTVQDNAQTGASSQFTMNCRQMLRGKAKVITRPTDQSQALVGSGQTKALGSTSTTDVTI